MKTSTTAQEDREQIETAIRNFINSYNAGELQGIIDCYSDDLIKLRNGSSPETKRETLNRIAEVFKEFTPQLEVKNEELVIADTLAFCRGELKVTLTPKKGGNAQRIHRRFIEIWQKRNGMWQVTRTMDNIS